MIKQFTDKLCQLVKSRVGVEYNEKILRKNSSTGSIHSEINIGLNNTGTPPDELTGLVDKVLNNSVQTNHAMFMNQMYGKQLDVAVLADMLTPLVNTSMYTYEVAPVMTLIEKECNKRLCSFVWNKDDGVNDGVFTPGSSISNMIAMVMARDKKFPEIKPEGLFDHSKFSIFVSEQAHYSFLKGALFLGFGKESIVKVKTDGNGKIDTLRLTHSIEKQEQAGKIPLMLVGVAGTTFSGVFDDLEVLSKVAKKHGLWFHIDAAYGGSLLFSSKEKSKLNGINHADSVAWSLHKMMGIPLVCAVLLTRECGKLNETFAVKADYLFHEDDEMDLGQKSLQCGRRVDALKLWLAWKYEGDLGFEKRVNELMKTAYLFANKVQSQKNMELHLLPESPIVCFRFWRQGLSRDELNFLNKNIRNCLFEKGNILFNYSTYEDRIYLRCVISDPTLNEAAINFILNEINAVGIRLLEELFILKPEKKFIGNYYPLQPENQIVSFVNKIEHQIK